MVDGRSVVIIGLSKPQSIDQSIISGFLKWPK